MPLPEGIDFHIKEGKEIHDLYRVAGFENAILYDINHPRPDTIVIYAMYGNEIVAMAGASADSSLMWQIGIDVLPKFRNKGLATSLVSDLAIMIMEPFLWQGILFILSIFTKTSKFCMKLYFF